MPKPVFYRADSIVYFFGDRTDVIPILKKGRVEIVRQDLQTGVEERETINTGEFFGVKAALGRNPHDETAMAVSDCTVIHFSIPEFEELVSGNPRILMKMLQVFSHQLRRIHHQVQNLISSEGIGTSQEAGLFAVGEYYLKEKQYSQASHVFKSYLRHWPKGIYAPQATLKVTEADDAKIMNPEPSNEFVQNSEFTVLSYDECNNLYKNGHYKEAMKGFVTMLKEAREEDHRTDAEFRLGACLYRLDQYDDASKQLTNFLRHYPNHSKFGEAIWYMGLIHEAMDDKEKAIGFFNKAEQMVAKGSPLYRQILDKKRMFGK